MENRNLHKIKMLLLAVLGVLLLLADIYLIVNAPNNYIAYGTISFILIMIVLFLISSMIKIQDIEYLRKEEQYQSLMTSQRACFLLVRKKFKEIDYKILDMEQKIAPLERAGEVNQQKISSLLDSLMQDQKKIAKITVSRSKENADALMNSNDRMLEKMEKFQSTMKNIEAEMTQDQMSLLQHKTEAMERGQEVLIKKVQEFEQILKKSLQLVTEKEDSLTEDETNSIYIEETQTGEEPLEDTAVLPEEEEVLVEDTAVLPERSNGMMTPEQIAELLAAGDLEPAMPIPEPVQAAPIQAVPSQATPIKPIEEDSLKAKPPLPVAEDANKAMSPEDIAALIANL